MMITKELALTLRVGQELWHNTQKNSDGTPVRARVNGRVVSGKRTPHIWRLPVKHGLKMCFNIGENSYPCENPREWSLPERWAIENVL
jgi:hypothetical protein